MTDTLNTRYTDRGATDADQRNKPTTFRDLDSLIHLLGLTGADCQVLIGVNRSRYDSQARDKEAPLGSATHALTVRLLRDYPGLNWLPTPPTPSQFLERVHAALGDNAAVRKPSIGQLSLMLGRHYTRGSQWEAGKAPTASVNALLLLLDSYGKQHGYDAAWSLLTAIAEREAFARGMDIHEPKAAWPSTKDDKDD